MPRDPLEEFYGRSEAVPAPGAVHAGGYGLDRPPGFEPTAELTRFLPEFQPTWLSSLLEGTGAPIAVDASPVRMFFDIFQRGWPLGIPFTAAIVTPASTTSFTLSCFGQQVSTNAAPTFTATFDAAYQKYYPQFFRQNPLVLLGLDITHLNGAAPGVPILSYRFNRSGDPSSNPFPQLAKPSIAVGVTADWFTIFGARQFLHIPPSLDLVINIPTTAAGEVYTIHMAGVALPPGGAP